jgi:hypothetical protein
MGKIGLLALLMVLAIGCGRKSADNFGQLRDEFVYESLAF